MLAKTDPNSPRPGMTSNTPSSVNAPSVTLPLRFMITGLGALISGLGLLVVRPDVLSTYHYNQYVIAITHLFVLGWICTIVMGAMYQLVPVALEARLYSEKLAAIQFVLHAVGFIGMVWMFWTWNLKQVGHYGSVLGFGVLLFAYNIARTLFRVPRWNVVALAVSSTIGWLLFTVLAGLTIAAGKCSYESLENPGAFSFFIAAAAGAAKVIARFDAISAMHAHAHLGVVGVFIMLIVGVSYRLVPMFTLSDLQNERRATASVILLNVGLLGAFFAVLLRSQWKPVFVLLLATGLVLYGLEIRAILRARKRRVLDWGVKYFLTAIGFLLPLTALGATLSWPRLPLTQFTGQLENAYGFVALIGLVSLAIIGMLYKIIPFIVWYSRYSKLIGLCKVPSLADLYSHRLQVAGYISYLAGLAVTLTGIVLSRALVVRIGACLLFLAGVILVMNVLKMLSHMLGRGTQPAVSRPAASMATTAPTPMLAHVGGSTLNSER